MLYRICIVIVAFTVSTHAFAAGTPATKPATKPATAPAVTSSVATAPASPFMSASDIMDAFPDKAKVKLTKNGAFLVRDDHVLNNIIYVVDGHDVMLAGFVNKWAAVHNRVEITVMPQWVRDEPFVFTFVLPVEMLDMVKAQNIQHGDGLTARGTIMSCTIGTSGEVVVLVDAVDMDVTRLAMPKTPTAAKPAAPKPAAPKVVTYTPPAPRTTVFTGVRIRTIRIK